MNLISMFKKVYLGKLTISEESPKFHQSSFEDIANKLRFKRCSEGMLRSIGFVHPMDDHITDTGISYTVGDWFIFTIQMEEKKVSASEVNYELQMIMNDIEKNEHRKLNKNEKAEYKEKIYEEKAKTAPSTFSRYNLAFDKKGNLFVNTTSDKPLESIIEILMRAFKEYFVDIRTGFFSELPLAGTQLLKHMNAEIPEGVHLSLGSKGEGKRNGQKMSFNNIISDDKNILSMMKEYDLEVQKIELYDVYKNAPVSYYLSKKGVEGIGITEEFKAMMDEKLQDISTEEEAVDVSLKTMFDMLIQFHIEYFIFMKKVISFAGVNPEMFNKTFNDINELTNFLTPNQ